MDFSNINGRLILIYDMCAGSNTCRTVVGGDNLISRYIDVECGRYIIS
jgi:hypothetical protein